MRVLVVDDNPIVRIGLRTMLSDLPQVSEVVEAANGQQALAAATGPEPFDVVLLDVRMPVMDGLTALEGMPGVPVVMLTSSEDGDTVRRALALGAKGYLVHGEFGEAELLATLLTCSQGGMVLSPPAAVALAAPAAPPPPAESVDRAGRHGLTVREAELVAALAEGLSNAQIAKRLFLSEKTVKNHLNRIYAKMAVASRAEAIVAWLSD
jgi:DNA-binding NarL/FixJ family response regulator